MVDDAAKLRVHFGDGETVEADLMLVAVGRAPLVEGIVLEKHGLFTFDEDAPVVTLVGGTAPAPAGTAIGPASSVPVGGSATFTIPKTGDPGLVIQNPAGTFTAFDAICPHSGCTVAYQPSAKVIVCPCHGSEFNPKTGDVTVGPATTGLTPVKVVRGASGDLYAV